ncbi:hypothetical protein [Ruminococcus bicirculans (ex Wegman et al. 2014)]|uniref:hypothetical protein n=1 Tax=Ruminococcus bicirculans (ex Wegman et al. 2014) TaxID=1160721 RepID=UPI00243325DA|nr:hypothetical protein [Ruminococcus bicirculans (ex Wegman et al. 2014)]MBS6919690.1 hypothetical protein [Ruminococcus bicirculans (ex Wegman et al. 2014)]
MSNLKQLRFTISRNGDKAKTVLKTSYDIVSLPYLLTYVMGLFFEEYANEGVGFSTSELTNMLLTMYPKDFAVSAEQADLVIDDLETWERNCSSYDTIRTIRIFKPKELNLSEKLFCELKKHFKQNGFHAVYAETNEESLIIFYRPKSNQRVFGIRRNCYSKNGNSIEIGLLINENTFLWFKTAAIVSYKNNNLKSIFNDVIQEINKITIDEKALPQDKFRNPYVACLEYLSKYGYSIKTIEWE